jgi:hypothetical protein
VTGRRSILHPAARCIAAIALFGCDQVLGIEEAHVDPALEAHASAGGAATNVTESSAGGAIQMTSSLDALGGASGEGGLEP